MRVLLISNSGTKPRLADLATSLGWNMTCVPTVDDAFEFLQNSEFQVILVSISDQPTDAYSTIRCLARGKCAAPIIACLEGKQVDHRFRAMKLGAITSVQMPSSAVEIEIVVRAIVRHTHVLPSNTISTGDVSLNFIEKRFQIDGAEISFTLRQYQLLEFLFLNKGKPVSRTRIMNHLYDGEEEPQEKIVDVLVCKIRQRLRAVLGEKNVIETVWGLGFRVNDCQKSDSMETFYTRRAA